MSPRRAIAHLSWPLVMGGSLLATRALVSAGWPLSRIALAMTIGNFATVVLLETLLPRDPRTSLLRDRQAVNDALHGVLFSALGRPVASALSLALVTALAASPSRSAAAPLWPVALPLALQVVLALHLWGFVNYWLHRLFHRAPRLWAFHALHHDTPRMHVLKSGRLHVGEQMALFFAAPAPLLLLGVPAEVLLWLGLWNVFEGNLAHSNLDQRFPRWMHYAVQTPDVHYVHHAADPELHDSNFSGPTALFDLAFGTFKHPDDHPVTRLGLAEESVPRGFVAQVVEPFRRLVAAPRPGARSL
jgi:sterol desaturase/sphingolipid hydroxylase (fatty acid hydroxylase superfamily)